MFLLFSDAAFSAVSFEQIEESYLKEDFASTEKLATQFLSASSNNSQAEEVKYLRAVSLVKLDRVEEGRSELLKIEQSNASREIRMRASDSLAYVKAPALLVQAPILSAGRALPQMGIEESTLLYCVQVGSFSKQSNAERLLNRLLRNRYEAYIQQDAVGRLFRVRVGQLAQRVDAITLQRRLKKDGYPTKIFP